VALELALSSPAGTKRRDYGDMEVSRDDGSVIAVEVAGQQGATPVLFCHGLADSRLSAHLFAPAARELGLCLVAPDRPGIGRTDPRRLRVWSGQSDQAAARFFAAAVPVAYWAPFFLAPLVPGTAVDDPPYPVQRVAGVPVSLLGAAATVTTAAVGWLIDRRSLSAVQQDYLSE
jgi:hypothetical protein